MKRCLRWAVPSSTKKAGSWELVAGSWRLKAYLSKYALNPPKTMMLKKFGVKGYEEPLARILTRTLVHIPEKTNIDPS